MGDGMTGGCLTTETAADDLCRRRVDCEVLGVVRPNADSYMMGDEPLCSTVEVIAINLERPPLRRARVFLALIAGLKQWTASMGASHTFVHVTTGSNLKATDRLVRGARATILGGDYFI